VAASFTQNLNLLSMINTYGGAPARATQGDAPADQAIPSAHAGTIPTSKRSLEIRGRTYGDAAEVQRHDHYPIRSNQRQIGETSLISAMNAP
jgi:hypothetical protein